MTIMIMIMIMIMIGVVCTFYSALGGMKAVLMTDVFQSLLMFAAIFSVISTTDSMLLKSKLFLIYSVCSCIDANGFTPILETAWYRGRIEFFNISPDPTVRHTLWTQVMVTYY